MYKKNSIMKLLIMFFIVLVITLIVLVIFLIKRIQGLEKYETTQKKDSIKTNIIEKKYSVKDIEGLYFDFMNSKVNYHSYKGDKILIKQKGKTSSYLVNKNINNKKIYFSESTTSIFGKTIFNIYIPNSYINTISIKNGFGNIKIDSFNNFLIIDNNAGNVLIDNTNDINIKDVSGYIRIKKINGLLNLYSSTGDITINELDGNTEIETITGNVKIKKFIISNKSKIYSTSGDINIKIDKNSDCVFKYNKNDNYKITKNKCKNGRNEFSIKSVTGIITIK